MEGLKFYIQWRPQRTSDGVVLFWGQENFGKMEKTVG